MRGEKILDIVPDEDALTVEAQVNVDDISEVHPDMVAEVHVPLAEPEKVSVNVCVELVCPTTVPISAPPRAVRVRARW